MDGFTMLALIVYVLANVTIAALRARGYVKMVGFFSLMLFGFIFANSLSSADPSNTEIYYLVFALPPAVLFLGDMLYGGKK